MRTVSLALAIGLVASTATFGQSLSPMQHAGTTPTDTKGFKLLVGNPYPNRMTFLITPMDGAFETEIDGAVVKPNVLTLAPGKGRSVIVAFKIDSTRKERTIGVCVVPKDLDGPILPRVCGRYTGRLREPGKVR